MPAEWGDELRFKSTGGFWGRKKGECTDDRQSMLINCGYDTAGKILGYPIENIDGSSLKPKDMEWMDKGVL